MTLYLIKMLLYGLLLVTDSPMLNKVKNFLRKGLFFNDLLTILLETFLEIMISVCYELKEPLTTTNGEKASLVYTTVYIGLIALFLPAALIYIIRQPSEKLQEEDFKE